MSGPVIATLKKRERLCSRTLIEKLFHKGGSRSMAAFPLRLVYMPSGGEVMQPSAQILVSVPKRCFKRAVKRNRVKRQVREAYRKHKAALYGELEGCGVAGVSMAFIWLDDKLWDTKAVESKVANLMQRLAEKLKGQ